MITRVQRGIVWVSYRPLPSIAWSCRRRTCAGSAPAIPHKQLVAGIRCHGVLQNVVVVPLNGTPDPYGEEAGSRRLAAVGGPVGTGEMDPAMALPCLVQAEPDATPQSLTENFQRTALLHPSPEFVAFEALAREGRSERDIARSYWPSARNSAAASGRSSTPGTERARSSMRSTRCPPTRPCAKAWTRRSGTASMPGCRRRPAIDFGARAVAPRAPLGAPSLVRSTQGGDAPRYADPPQ